MQPLPSNAAHSVANPSLWEQRLLPDLLISILVSIMATTLYFVSIGYSLPDAVLGWTFVLLIVFVFLPWSLLPVAALGLVASIAVRFAPPGLARIAALTILWSVLSLSSYAVIHALGSIA